MPDNAGIAPETLATLRDRLEKERARLHGLAQDDSPGVNADMRGADENDGAIREPEDFGEMGFDITQTDIGRALGDNDRRLLAQVEHALQRMDGGAYGVSEISGKPIPLERLDALPWATTNVDDPDPNPQPDTQPTY